MSCLRKFGCPNFVQIVICCKCFLLQHSFNTYIYFCLIFKKILFFYFFPFSLLLLLKCILFIMLLQFSQFFLFIPPPPCTPQPFSIPLLVYVHGLYISSLSSLFPIPFLTSPVFLMPTNYASSSLYLFPLYPPPTPTLITFHVISIPVILFLFQLFAQLVLGFFFRFSC